MAPLQVIPEVAGPTGRLFRAFSGEAEAIGETIGAAIDGLDVDLDHADGPVVIVVRNLRPDRFFTADQQNRLADLMAKGRSARESGTTLPPDEQTELDELIQAELKGATERSAEILRRISP